MTPRHKFNAIVFVTALVLTAVCVCLGFLFGIKFLLLFILVAIALVALVSGIVLAGPATFAHRLYTKRPPRKMYEELSSKEGYWRFEELPHHFLEAVRCAEDPHFYEHKGIDIESLLNAIARFLLTDLKPIGASTITQQLIKNVYLTPEASVKRKLAEMLMTRRMERSLSKNEMLELYVNIIYYGCGQYGVRNAAKYYYDIEPSALNFDQGLSLAAILPCPDKYHKEANPLFFNQRKIRVLSSMYGYSDVPLDQMKIDIV